MKMKRFLAPTMREAIARVRSEQGPDAVILSSKRVEGGVEIVTAIDYDESLVQQALGSPARSAAVAEAAERPRTAQPAAFPPADPAISKMQRQVDSMRHLLESQLSSLAWNDLTRQHPARARVLNDLIALDIAPDIARQLADEMPVLKSTDGLWRIPPALLVRRLPVIDDKLLEQGGVIAEVGQKGVGKTT